MRHVHIAEYKRRKKCPGNSSVLAVSTALTEGNGPYSNPLKDEGHKRFKMHRDEREEETKQRGRGVLKRPPFYGSLSPHSEWPSPH